MEYNSATENWGMALIWLIYLANKISTNHAGDELFKKKVSVLKQKKLCDFTFVLWSNKCKNLKCDYFVPTPPLLVKWFNVSQFDIAYELANEASSQLIFIITILISLKHHRTDFAALAETKMVL